VQRIAQRALHNSVPKRACRHRMGRVYRLLAGEISAR
jgi:hypothetical protein